MPRCSFLIESPYAPSLMTRNTAFGSQHSTVIPSLFCIHSLTPTRRESRENFLSFLLPFAKLTHHTHQPFIITPMRQRLNLSLHSPDRAPYSVEKLLADFSRLLPCSHLRLFDHPVTFPVCWFTTTHPPSMVLFCPFLFGYPMRFQCVGGSFPGDCPKPPPSPFPQLHLSSPYLPRILSSPPLGVTMKEGFFLVVLSIKKQSGQQRKGERTEWIAQTTSMPRVLQHSRLSGAQDGLEVVWTRIKKT